MIRYVVGFQFDQDLKNVVLIKKNKPEWQSGKLNGVGGKLEPGEAPIEAMRREFYEEAGVPATKWTFYIKCKGEGYECYFYHSVVPFIEATSQTDEEIVILSVKDLWNFPVVFNLRWLIPMAIDTIQHDGEKYTTIKD